MTALLEEQRGAETMCIKSKVWTVLEIWPESFTKKSTVQQHSTTSTNHPQTCSVNWARCRKSHFHVILHSVSVKLQTRSIVTLSVYKDLIVETDVLLWDYGSGYQTEVHNLWIHHFNSLNHSIPACLILSVTVEICEWSALVWTHCVQHCCC